MSEKSNLDLQELIKFDDYLSQLSAKYSEQAKDTIDRIGQFVKEKLRVIPKPEVFAKWVLENRVLNDNRDITDEELMQCAKIYLSELNIIFDETIVHHLPTSVKDNPQSKRTHSLNWTGSEDDLITMFNFLTSNFIDNKTDFQSFKNIFSSDISLLEKPVRWTESIRLLVYFFEMLYSNGLINNTRYPSIIEKLNLIVDNQGKQVKSQNLTSTKNAYRALENTPKKSDVLEKLIPI